MEPSPEGKIEGVQPSAVESHYKIDQIVGAGSQWILCQRQAYPSGYKTSGNHQSFSSSPAGIDKLNAAVVGALAAPALRSRLADRDEAIFPR
jgi:hypothetical protein